MLAISFSSLNTRPEYIGLSLWFFLGIDDLILLPNEFKVVVYHPSDLLWAQGFLPELPSDCALFVQPEWDRRDKISADILRFIHDNPQWRLSLQTHKYVGIP